MNKRLPTERVNLTVPRVVHNLWAPIVEPRNDQKWLGTALLALAVGMPPELREQLWEWGRDAERRTDLAADVRSCAEGFIAAVVKLVEQRRKMMLGRDTSAPPLSDEAVWFVDRILDPALLNAAEAIRRKAG